MSVIGERTNDHEYSITIHGTWAALKKKSKWWRPGGGLFRYLQKNPQPDPNEPDLGPVGANLYDRWDRFSWTGRFAKEARMAGAQDLARWCAKPKRSCRLDKVFAHSHGGNVALDSAQQFGTRINLLVLMNTPAHNRSDDEWEKIARVVERIVILRSHFDFVALSDRCYSKMAGIPASGGFPHDRVYDHPIPKQWFNHSAITRTRVWKRNELAMLVAREADKAGKIPMG